MVRFIKKNTHKFEFLPPSGENEDKICPICQQLFDRRGRRRCSPVTCGHIFCLQCVIDNKSTSACQQCSADSVEDSGGAVNCGGTPVVDNARGGEDLPTSSYGVRTKRMGAMRRRKSLAKKAGGNAQEVDGHGRSSNDCGPSVHGKGQGNFDNGENDDMVELKVVNRSCKHCSRIFYDKNDLLRHLRRKHGKVRPFHCEMCEWCFETAGRLDDHRRRHRNAGEFPSRRPIRIKKPSGKHSDF